VSENTVKHHLTKIFEKLALENRSQLVQRLVEYERRPHWASARKSSDAAADNSNGLAWVYGTKVP
jgi:hypothetical protein